MFYKDSRPFLRNINKPYPMFSRILMSPFVFGILYFLYRVWQYDEEFNILILPLVLIAVVIYLLEPQLNWWWAKRNPPKIDEKMQMLLQQHNPFYQRLSLEEKKRFRTRMALYMEAKEFRPLGGPETVPADAMGFIAAAAVQLSFGQEDFLMEPFEHILIYPGAFPSPQYPTYLHTNEHFKEDGVIMFAVKGIMDSVRHSPKTYHIVLHEYAAVFEETFLNKDFPDLSSDIWESLEAMSKMNQDFVDKSIGIPETPVRPVSIHHFFMFPRKFKELLPDLYAAYVAIFNLDPVEGHTPVVDGRVVEA